MTCPKLLCMDDKLWNDTNTDSDTDSTRWYSHYNSEAVSFQDFCSFRIYCVWE